MRPGLLPTLAVLSLACSLLLLLMAWPLGHWRAGKVEVRGRVPAGLTVQSAAKVRRRRPGAQRACLDRRGRIVSSP
jgi:hypothetical protein